MTKGLREQAKEEAKMLMNRYNQMYVTFLIEELQILLVEEIKEQ